MELIVGRWGSAPHRPGGSKNTVEGRHEATGCGRRKLLLRHIFRSASMTCEAEPAWRDCTCGSGSGSPTKCER